MDWANERYVRLYTRDTVTWLRLRWEGQCVLVLALRKLDRAGVLDLGGVDPHEAIETVTGLPMEVAKAGLDRCLQLGVFVIDGDRLLMPKFLDAQEATASNAERQRRHRAKKKALDGLSRNATDSDENVTGGNALSHAVTPSNSVPCLTVLNQGEGLTPIQQDHLPRARAREDPLPPPDFDPEAERGVTPIIVWKRWEQEAGGPAGEYQYQEKHCASVARQCQQYPDPPAILDQVVTAIWTAFAERNPPARPQIKYLASDFDRYANNGKAKQDTLPFAAEIAEVRKRRKIAEGHADTVAMAQCDEELYELQAKRRAAMGVKL